MKRILLTPVFLSILFFNFSCDSQREVQSRTDLRAPAYPLITVDPYTSGWSFNNKLYEGPVRHWTGREEQLIGVVQVDGENYRFLGEEKVPMQLIVPTFEKEHWEAQYTTETPEGKWMDENYDASSWKTGKGSFGSPGRLKAITSWLTPDIWVRREVDINSAALARDLFLEYSHDDGVKIYINGHEVINTGSSAKANVMYALPDKEKKYLKPGKNIIAAHCHDDGGESFLDFGLWMRKDDQQKFNQTATQKDVTVFPLQTQYTFEAGGVELMLTFTAPLLMDDLDLLSRPINYITYNVEAVDGNEHDVSVYIEGSPQWAQDVDHQPIVSERVENDQLNLLKSGTKSQDILGKKGDDVRIDWGYVYFATPKGKQITSAIGSANKVRAKFIKNGQLENVFKPSEKGDLTEDMEALSFAQTFEKVGKKSQRGYVMLGYDDLYSIQYFGENLRPYWNRNGDKTIEEELALAAKNYTTIIDRCNSFDKQVMKEAIASGGEKYAELIALAYRQSVSAHKIVEAPNKDLLWLSKENFSNGSIGTVDITYPSSPLYLMYNPELVKGLLNHIFYYSESGKWDKPFAAHDVGTYPMANGQTYGGDMPIEETGNMLIVTAALAHVENNVKYAEKHWQTLTTWADYLVEKGLDPENQLCTDDFAGHFAHNVNLSVKAIMGIASYGFLADKLGKKEIGEKYTQKAKEMAQEWMEMADDGDHYRLTFDKPGTWSQKYNLIWNKILKFDIFSKSVAKKELDYYLTKQNEYGLPLDSRANYTKADWIIWTATLSDDDSTFQKFVDPVFKFYDETIDRVPLSDWYNTDNKTHVGFQARSVVGGFYIKMLADKLNRK